MAGFADTVVVTGLVVEPDDAAAAAAACAWARFRSGVEPELFMMRNFLVLTGVPNTDVQLITSKIREKKFLKFSFLDL